MRYYVEVIEGPAAPKTASFESQAICEVGQSAGLELGLPEDASLKDTQFLLYSRQDRILFYDAVCRDEFPTFVNGEKAQTASVETGAEIAAGSTKIVVFLEHPRLKEDEQLPPPPKETPFTKLIAELRKEEGSVYALFDEWSAQDQAEGLAEFAAPPRYMYEEVVERLNRKPPVVLDLNLDPRALNYLVRACWGRNCLALLFSKAEVDDVAAHIKSLLELTRPDDPNRKVPIQEPKALRGYLSTCDEERGKAFFGPIDRIIVEGAQAGTALRFQLRGGEMAQDKIQFFETQQPPAEAGKE